VNGELPENVRIEIEAGAVAEDRALAAEVRREYRTAAQEYPFWPEDREKPRHGIRMRTVGSGIKPAPG
jgi:hypothetical protein